MLPDTLQNALLKYASTIVGAESGKRVALRNEQQATEQMVHACMYAVLKLSSGTQALSRTDKRGGASLEAQPNNGPDGLLLHRAH